MRQRILVTDFSLGMVSESAVPRVDQTKAVAELEGFMVLPDGGIIRRPGSIFVRRELGISPGDMLSSDTWATTVTGGGNAASTTAPTGSLWGGYANSVMESLITGGNIRSVEGYPSFVIFERFNGTLQRNQLYIGFFRDGEFSIQNMESKEITLVLDAAFSPGTLLENTRTVLDDIVDMTDQHLHIYDEELSRMMSLAHPITLTDMGNIRLSAVFQGRFVVGNILNGVVTMSVPYDFTNFDEDQGALVIIPDFYGTETLQWIESFGSNLYIGTDKGEWEITSSYPYFSNELGGLIVRQVSRIGGTRCQKFGNALIIAKDRRVIKVIYAQGTYQGASLSEFIKNNDILLMKVLEYGSHQYLFVLDTELVLWCLTESEGTGVNAWSQVATDVGWMDTHEQDLYVAKPFGTLFHVEVMPLDTIRHPGNRSQDMRDVFATTTVRGDSGGFRKISSLTSEGDALPPLVEVVVYKVGEGDSVGDISYIGTRMTNNTGQLTGTLNEIKTFVGFTGETVYIYCYPVDSTFPSRIKTLPITLGTALGPGLSALRRISKVVVSVIDTRAFRVRANEGPWEIFESDVEYTGIVETAIDCSHADKVQIEVESIGDKPLHIHTIQIDAVMGDE